MKALSLRQPWATLVAYRFKSVETRTWQTKFRGKCLVHASQTVDEQAMRHFRRLYPSLKYPTGCIVGWMVIGDCVYYSTERQFVAHKVYHRVAEVYGPQRGKYGFVLTDAGPSSLVDCPGNRNFFNVPASVVKQVRLIRLG